MTAKQKANQARFKKVVAEAKKLRKKNPKLTQAQAVKQAWAMMYSTKKVSGYSKERNKIHKNATSWIKRYQKRNDDDYKTAVKKGYDQAPFGPAPVGNAKTKHSVYFNNDANLWGVLTPEGYDALGEGFKTKAEAIKEAKILDKELQMEKKVGAVKKKAAKKKAAPKKSSSYHKDTKSHNVNIRVMSGTTPNMYTIRDNYEKEIKYYLDSIERIKNSISTMTPIEKGRAKFVLNTYKKVVVKLKKQLKDQNKLINDLFK